MLVRQKQSAGYIVKGVSRRQFMAGAGAAAVALAAPSISLAQSMERIVLRTDLSAWGSHVALFHAQHQGWFAEAGLEVDIQDGTGTLNTINLVGAGQIDVGFAQLGPMSVAKLSGVPVQSISGFLRKNDLAVIVDRETGPATPQELAGKKLVCFATSPWAPFIDSYLARFGLTRGTGPDAVEVVMVSPPAMASTYAAGDADGFMSLSEYALPLVEQVRPGRALSAVDAGIYFPSYGFVVNEEAIETRGDALRRLNQTQARAWKDIVENVAAFESAVDAMIAARPNAQLSRDVVAAQARLSLDFLDTENAVGNYGWQSEKDWQSTIDYLVSINMMPATASPSDFFTNDLIVA